VPLLLMLVPRYGLEGVGSALLISATVRFVIVLASFPLILKVRVPRLILTSADLAAIAAAGREEWGRR
jgi:enterobacterial common antigen flippase